VFNGLHDELGGDLVVVDCLEVGTNETNKKPSLALTKYLFFLACVMWEVWECQTVFLFFYLSG
jgi:hypothetical protein